MERCSIPKATGAAFVAVLALATTAAAQNVSIDGTYLQLGNAAGPTVFIDQFGGLFLGGAGAAGNITLRDAGGTNGVFVAADSSDLFLGSPGNGGNIILRGADGTTTTVNLEGEFGLITLGGGNEPGDLTLWDDEPPNASSISLSGGTVSNQVEGNGLVKAWALLEADGTLDECYACNPDPTRTFQTPAGRYRVDFDPLGFDLTGRPILCQLGETSLFFPKSVQCEWFGSTTVEVVVFHLVTSAPESRRIRVLVF